jgi:uncharacterized membrane protein
MGQIPNDDEGKDEAIPKWVIAFTALVATAALIFYGYTYFTNEKYDVLGTWGDFVGGTLNPILTFATFIGLLYTIHLQQRELRLTRNELSLTRQEFERSSNALEAQNLTTKQQRFENTLFSMIEMLNQIVNTMDVVVGDKNITGRDCFTRFYNSIHKLYNMSNKRDFNGTTKIIDDSDGLIAIGSYNRIYDGLQTDLGHYFRVLYNIFRYIDQSEFADGIYAKILRAQLSNQELLIIFYNNATERGKAFAALAERFELYDNLNTEQLLRPEHIELASKKSFGKNPMTLPEEREQPG